MDLIAFKTYFISIAIGYAHGYENLAYHKPAWQNSLHDSSVGPEKVVDGLYIDRSYTGKQCSVSRGGTTATWWVNLQSILSIHNIVIYYRTDNLVWDATNPYTTRFLGFYVFISNTTDKNTGYLCFRDTNYTRSTIPDIANITCPVHGQYVIYYNERLSGVTYPSDYSTRAMIELCEVLVYGCQDKRYYGSNCSNPCPANCNQSCHIETGVCFECIPGYKGVFCDQECINKTYGEACNSTCGKCLDSERCHHINGSCFKGCDAGYQGSLCKSECMPGKYGINCEKTCSENCSVTNRCNHTTGQCEGGCKPGWRGLLCDKECAEGQYGRNCWEECGSCEYQRPCHHVNGTCREGCEPGYRGDKCVDVCMPGKYGTKCGDMCSEHCSVTNRCNHTTGQCQGGCKPGWRGLLCDKECAEGQYGLNCWEECGMCEYQLPCHHVNGTCREGCRPGYRGDKCIDVCKYGYFGVECKEECSTFCKLSRDCNHVTGSCKEGCKAGWQGHDCFQIQAKEEPDWQSRFYGVFAALCVCLTVLAVVIVAVCLKRRSKSGAQMQHTCNDSQNRQRSISYIDEKKDRNAKTEYQELGNRMEPSIYDQIK